mmetsp:Transcript_22862/g.53489  ORF Transcript_22862/g.53489 Transcript_22862/m.53489 type:complete len:267 (+) Transcript_22862:141-941(+)
MTVSCQATCVGLVQQPQPSEFPCLEKAPMERVTRATSSRLAPTANRQGWQPQRPSPVPSLQHLNEVVMQRHLRWQCAQPTPFGERLHRYGSLHHSPLPPERRGQHVLHRCTVITGRVVLSMFWRRLASRWLSTSPVHLQTRRGGAGHPVSNPRQSFATLIFEHVLLSAPSPRPLRPVCWTSHGFFWTDRLDLQALLPGPTLETSSLQLLLQTCSQALPASFASPWMPLDASAVMELSRLPSQALKVTMCQRSFCHLMSGDESLPLL